ncbi:MAG TPA: trigger factor [Humisphaera sp.]|jgi:trigger factor|nr:trigger factor [Humisphaera sp.]
MKRLNPSAFEMDEVAMSENETNVADATDAAETSEEQEFQYDVRIEAAGPAAKKVTVEIPKDRINEKLEEQYRELRRHAAIPGFRVGHAPRKLIEKRFSDDIKEQVRGLLIQESYKQAIEKNDLQVLGEPQFDNPDLIQLPEDGPLTYSFEVEVAPDITLPDFSTLKVKKPKIEITEENVDQAMKNLREQQGTLIPVEDRGVEAGDYLLADVHVKLGEEEIAHQHDAQIVSRAGRIAGIQIDDLDKQLEGLKSGETRTFTVRAPETHATEKLRGQDVQIEVSLKDIKRLELAEITQSFLEDLGFDNEAELRKALREQMEEKIAEDVQTAMRQQVNAFLMEKVQFELPAKLSDRQAERVVNRRAVDLMMRGMPREQVEANVERLKAGAQDEAMRELKLFFILQKIATDNKMEVSEGELNGRVAFLAAQRDERPERLKQTMSKDGSLSNLYIQMREQKAIDQILTQAQVEEVELKQGETVDGTKSE